MGRRNPWVFIKIVNEFSVDLCVTVLHCSRRSETMAHYRVSGSFLRVARRGNRQLKLNFIRNTKGGLRELKAIATDIVCRILIVSQIRAVVSLDVYLKFRSGWGPLVSWLSLAFPGKLMNPNWFEIFSGFKCMQVSRSDPRPEPLRS